MDGYAVALGNKADDIVPGDRRAAAAELDHARADILDNHARRVDGRLLLIEIQKLFGRCCLGCFCQFIPDPAHSLDGGETAKTDGGVHIIQAVETDPL